MFLTEWQGKRLLAAAGIAVPRGAPAWSRQEAAVVAEAHACEVVVKLQVGRGGRGKRGQVVFAASPAEAAEAFTRVVADSGERDPFVLVEDRVAVRRELYAAVHFDAVTSEVVLLSKAAGGVDVEDEGPHAGDLRRRAVSLVDGPTAEALADISAGVVGSAAGDQALADVFALLYDVFCANDAELVEVNPLVLTEDGSLVACDAKVVVDDYALNRHPGLGRPDAGHADDFAKAMAAAGVEFIDLGGEVAVVSPGAGLNMALIDWLYDVGLTPRCFLDITGAGVADWDALFSGGYPEHFAAAVRQAFEYLHDTGTTRFLVNVTSGGSPVGGRIWAILDVLAEERFADCDVVIHAAGHGQAQARERLEAAGMVPASTLTEAVQRLAGAVAS